MRLSFLSTARLMSPCPPSAICSRSSKLSSKSANSSRAVFFRNSSSSSSPMSVRPGSSPGLTVFDPNLPRKKLSRETRTELSRTSPDTTVHPGIPVPVFRVSKLLSRRTIRPALLPAAPDFRRNGYASNTPAAPPASAASAELPGNGCGHSGRSRDPTSRL